MNTGINHKMIIIGCGLASVIVLILAPFAIRASWQKADSLKVNGIQAIVEIVSLDWETTSESEKAIISFTDQSGDAQTMPLGFYSSDMYVGMKVPILYDPENVNTIMYMGGNSLFINYGSGFLLIVSALLLGLTAALMHKGYQKSENFIAGEQS